MKLVVRLMSVLVMLTVVQPLFAQGAMEAIFRASLHSGAKTPVRAGVKTVISGAGKVTSVNAAGVEAVISSVGSAASGDEWQTWRTSFIDQKVQITATLGGTKNTPDGELWRTISGQENRFYENKELLNADLAVYAHFRKPDHVVYLRKPELGLDSKDIPAGLYNVYKLPTEVIHYYASGFHGIHVDDHVLIRPADGNGTLQILTKLDEHLRANPLRAPMPKSFSPEAEFSSAQELWESIGGKTEYLSYSNLDGDLNLFFNAGSERGITKPLGQNREVVDSGRLVEIYDIYELPVDQITVAQYLSVYPRTFTKENYVVRVRTKDTQQRVSADIDAQWNTYHPAIEVISIDELRRLDERGVVRIIKSSPQLQQMLAQ